MTTMQKDDLVLITGISGYLATWVAKFLLEKGFRVRGTVRSTKNVSQQEKLKQILPGAEYVEADLRSEEGWDEAVKDVKWVFHIASPQAVASEKDRTGGAVAGTKYLMTAAFKSKTVQKIVVTSSEAAIAYGYDSSKVNFNEDDWTITGDKSADYFKSKTLAERLAWDLAKDKAINERNIPVSTINPGLILGPSLVPWARYSTETIQQIAEGKMPMLPDMLVHYVDVRDCAAMHIAIMKDPKTNGNRHLSFATYAKMVELPKIVSANYSHLGFNSLSAARPRDEIFLFANWIIKFNDYLDLCDEKMKKMFGERVKPAARTAPKFLLWIGKCFSKDVADIYGKLGSTTPYTTKYPNVYQYKYTDLTEIVKATIESLLEHKVLVPKN